jgi:hypothetical protein
MTDLEVTFNASSKKFSFVGAEAMDHTTSKKVSLNMAEIMQIIHMHKKGVFHTMLTNSIVKKNVAADHKSHAEMFLREDPVETILTSQSPTEESETDIELDASDSSSSSSSSSSSGKINLWHVYLKHIKSTHTDLTHKQAMQFGKTGSEEKGIIPYNEWKKKQ